MQKNYMGEEVSRAVHITLKGQCWPHVQGLARSLLRPSDSGCPKVKEPTCVHAEGLQVSQIPPQAETSSVLSGLTSISKALQEGRGPSWRSFSHLILKANAPRSHYNLTMKPYKGVLPY